MASMYPSLCSRRCYKVILIIMLYLLLVIGPMYIYHVDDVLQVVISSCLFFTLLLVEK